MNFADRLARARAATAAAGLDALLIGSGADLRYLTGYPGHGAERLTCLVLPAAGDPVLVVPKLERPAALASPLGGLGLEVLDWADGEDPYGLVAKQLPRPAGRVAVDDYMHAAKVLGLRAALPDAAQELAGPVLGPLRMRKAPDEVDGAAGGRRGDRPGARADGRVAAAGPDRAGGRPGHRRGDPGRGARQRRLHDRRLRAERRQPAPRGLRPGDRGRRAGGGRHRRHHRRRLLLGLHPHVRAGRAAGRVRRVLRGAAGGPGGGGGRGPARACRPSRSTRRPGTSIAAAGYGEAFLHRTGHGIGVLTHEDPYIVGRQHPAAGAGHGVQRRAGHLPRRPARRPDRGHRRRHRHGRRAPEPYEPRISANCESVVFVEQLDAVDRRLVRELTADGRASYTDLAVRVGLSVSAAHQRVRRLEQRGVIRGYSARIDPDLVGLPLTAFVSAASTNAPANCLPALKKFWSVVSTARCALSARLRQSR